jgi:type IV secretory pathway TrbD component
MLFGLSLAMTVWQILNHYQRVCLWLMAVGMSGLLGATANILIIGLTGWSNSIFGISLFFIFILAAVIVAWNIEGDNEITVVTSINAAYLCMRGLSMMIGGYPPESSVFANMFNPYADPIEIGTMFIIYQGIFVGLCFFFVFLQKNCKLLRPMT